MIYVFLFFLLVDPFCDVAADVVADVATDATEAAYPSPPFNVADQQPDGRGPSMGLQAESHVGDCPNGSCRVAREAQADEDTSCASCAAGTRRFPVKGRGLLRRIFSR